jgi:endonuclease G, mitochondrial
MPSIWSWIIQPRKIFYTFPPHKIYNQPILIKIVMVSLFVLLSQVLLAIGSTNFTKNRENKAVDGYDHLKYGHFELDFHCESKAALRWMYTLTPEIDGTARRPSGFYHDPNYPRSCQQLTTRSYGSGYDRGHLVTSSHMDMSSFDRRQAHYMTNILPQISNFNQGIWQKTELLTSCVRLLRPITVYGGVIFDDPSNDFFLKSHGVKTPDYWWKVLVTTNERGDEEVISWLFPNKKDLFHLDSYLLAVKDIETRLNDELGNIPITEDLKTAKPGSRWTQRCSATSGIIVD